MRIAVDIDGTISYRNERRYLYVCNEQLQLGIDARRLDTLSYQELLRQPELLAYQERVGDDYFRRAVGWIDFHSQVLCAAIPMTGAVEGVTRLASLGPVTYYTARFAPTSPQRSQAMADATYQWLHAQRFPASDSVVFCSNLKDKLHRLAECIEAEQTEFLLIDDQYARVISYISDLDASQRDILRRRMTLVAFKAARVPEQCARLRVLPLASWRQIDMLIGSFRSVLS